MPHDHAAGIAGQASRRFRGNVLAAFEHGLAGSVQVRQGRRVDVDHDLIALAGRARIDAASQGGFGEQRQSVGLLPLPCGRLVAGRHRGNVSRVCSDEGPLRARIQPLASGVQAPDEQLTDLGLKPTTHAHHPVVIAIDVERPAPMPGGRFAGFGVEIHPPPAAHDQLDMLGGAGAADLQQPFFGFGCRPRVSARTLA